MSSPQAAALTRPLRRTTRFHRPSPGTYPCCFYASPDHPDRVSVEEADYSGHAALVGGGHVQCRRHPAFLLHQRIQRHRQRIRHLYAPHGFQFGSRSPGHHQSAEQGRHGEHDDPPDCVMYPALRRGAFGPRGFEQDRGVSAKDQKEHWLIDYRHPADRHPD